MRGIAPDQLLGQPDERTIDAAYEAADQAARSRSLPSLMASPSIQPVASTSTSPPQSPAPRQPAQDSDSDLEVGPSSCPFISAFSSPTKPRKTSGTSHQHLDPLTIDLPVNYQNMLSLHSAFERAIMLYISTEGKAGLMASAVAHASQQASSTSTSYKVEIPNLAPYTALKSVVERASGLAFGEKQLSQLLWVWQRASDARLKRGDNTARGLGFILSRMTDASKSTGRKTTTWGVGIELEIKRHAPEPSMELLGASANPTRHRRVPSGGGARDGMSVVALWSQGSESRKELVRKTLGEMVLDQLDVSTFHKELAKSS